MWVALSKEGNSQRSKFLYFDSFFRDLTVSINVFGKKVKVSNDNICPNIPDLYIERPSSPEEAKRLYPEQWGIFSDKK